MKIMKTLIIGAICLSLTVPAALAEDAAGAVDAATSATQQQGNPGRGGKQQPSDAGAMDQAPENNGQNPGKNSQRRQKPGKSGQAPEEQAPDQGTQVPGQDLQAPDAGTPDPGTEGQRKHSGGKNGRKVLPGRQEENRNTDPQNGASSPALPEDSGNGTAAAPESADAVLEMIRAMEAKIKELKSLLETLNGSGVAE